MSGEFVLRLGPRILVQHVGSLSKSDNMHDVITSIDLKTSTLQNLNFLQLKLFSSANELQRNGLFSNL